MSWLSLTLVNFFFFFDITRTHICFHAHNNVMSHTHSRTHTHTDEDVRSERMYAHTHAYTHTHTHIHTHTQHTHTYTHIIHSHIHTYIGAGETKKSVGKALKLLKKTSTRRIPLVDPHHVIKETCRLYLQDLSLSYEQYACSTVDFLKRRVKTCCPDTLGAVALVYAASVASGVCDNAMCQRVAKASGLAASTLRKHVQTTLTPPLLPSS